MGIYTARRVRANLGLLAALAAFRFCVRQAIFRFRVSWDAWRRLWGRTGARTGKL